jgi:uncharacterized membrane protein YfcA
MSLADSILEDIQHGAGFVAELAQHNAAHTSLLIEGISAIASILSSAAPGQVHEAVAAIEAVITTLGGSLGGKVTPEDARAQMKTLAVTLASSDAKADAALAAKFDDGGGDGQGEG